MQWLSINYLKRSRQVTMNKYLILPLLLLSACTSTPEQQTIEVVKPRVIPQQPPTQPPVQAVIPKPKVQQPLPDIRGFRQTTYATWYQLSEHGNPTASGDVHDYYGMTAAHQNLPLGSQVRIRNLATGRSIVVTINDRQPSSAVKLSIFAAKKLGIWGKANQRVSIEGLSVKRIR